MKRNDTQPGSSSTRSRPRPIDLAQAPLPTRDPQRQKRQSVRLRPSELLDNAEPPSPLNGSSLYSVPASTAAGKMSLFHLFSRPKVERARGHAEKGLDAPAVTRKAGNGLKSSASTPNLALRAQHDLDAPPTPTVSPAFAPGAKPASRLKFKEPSKPAARERKPGSFDPPPLFQAYPQSMKDGMLELSLLSAETVQQKSKSRRAGGLPADLKAEAAAEDTSSLDTKRSTMAHLKHVASGSVTHVELPRKIFVLITSGYLLQYSDTGPSDRLPERMLHLGKESAAFACDLVPGKHYVLQVSQAVDEDGIVVINSGSLLSKLGIRTAAAKRMTSTFLLVMPDAREMGSWMTAIRKEIEARGGTRMEVNASAEPQPPSEVVDLRKTPSQSHRYKVQRDPSMGAPVTPPTEAPPPMPTPSPKREHDKSDTATIDGIEMEASKLTDSEPQPRSRTRSPSDAPSASSSTALSVDQQQLDNLRSSGSNKRFSKASQAPTVATTVTTSRANSLTGSPPSDSLGTASLDPVQESPAKPSYRMLASYSTRRRSAAPSGVVKDSQLLPGIDTSPHKFKATTTEHATESPVVGHNLLAHATAPSPQPSKRLSLARSEPNLHAAGVVREKHDSKVPLPPLPQDPEKERPESFVGDLPPPSTWQSTRVASRRTSMLQSASAMTAQAQGSPTRTLTSSTSSSPSQVTQPAPETSRPKRMSTFSIPLKINPSTPNSQPISTRSRRRSSAHDPDPPGETPVVHALTATVEPSRRASVAHTTMTAHGLQKSPSQRLSLFPAQSPSPPAATTTPSPRSSADQTPPAAANARTLRRPTSMQVRSDHAPFLSSMRNSTNGPPAVRNFAAPTAPIRGLKPSRSASNVPALAAAPTPPISIDALKDLDFGLPPPRDEADDKAMPLQPLTASRAQSPLPPPSRAGSRLSVPRGVKTRSSLPELDLGIPVVGLGPPAPPPSAPLPQPPTQSRPGSRLGASRPSSPAPAANGSPKGGGIDAIAGLGIRVS